jgi:hypothetical protein
MEIEGRLRSRIEAILTNDARNYAEIKRMAAPEEPLEADPFAEERNLYQRIINNYRNAVGEVNSLFEEHVAFLSGFYRIIESIKETDDFQKICAQIADCVMQDFGAEYCSLLFQGDEISGADALCLEGISERRKFIRVHSSPVLLGSEEFEAALGPVASESAGFLNIADVYREPRFNQVDFPSVVRSLVCLPITLRNTTVGLLVLGNSRARYFSENHIRVLRILAGTVAQLRFLTARRNNGLPALALPQRESAPLAEKDVFSMVLLDLEERDPYGRTAPVDKGTIDNFRRALQKSLQGRECVFFHDEDVLLVLLPGIPGEALPDRVGMVRASFQQWKAEQGEGMRNVRMNLGYSVSDGEDDLSRTLEIASLVRRPVMDEDPALNAAAAESP